MKVLGAWQGLWYLLGKEEGPNPALVGTTTVGRENQVIDGGGALSHRLLPLVPVGDAGDPQPAVPPGALPAPGFSHAYTAAIHFMQQNKPCRKRPPRCRAFPRRQWV